jgi:hypothetical protein
MPKDASKNVDRYKVRGGQLNEYEYQKNQGETAEEKTPLFPNKTKATNKSAEGSKKSGSANRAGTD